MVRVSSFTHAVLVLAGVAAVSAGSATAQTQPFVFTVTTLPGTAPTQKWGAHYEAGYAERTSAPFGYDGVEQRFVVQGSLSNGFTVLGQLGVGLGGNDDDSRTLTSQQVEILKDVRSAREGVGLTFGLGLRREWEGEKVLLARVALGRAFERSSLFMNLRFERPFDTQGEERDGLDLITTWGWMHQVSPTFHLGVEAVGEDLEGLWDTEEAEGGAKIFVGPSLRLAPSHASWSASVSGGPIFYATKSQRTSSAQRPLNATDNGYTVRLSLGYSF